jgi:hypothetical protein
MKEVKLMNYLKYLTLVGSVCLTAHTGTAISLDIVNVTGNSLPTSARLHFAGNSTFTFDDATTGANSGYDFIVNGSTGAGDSFGMRGNISGIFTIGAPSGSPESATVTSSAGAFLSIWDGTYLFKGAIDWVALTRDGTSGDLNMQGLVNLTGITYSGIVSDLLALKGSGDASTTIGFTFNPVKTITQLRTENIRTSYSGDLTSVPDGGASLLLLGMAFASLGLVRSKLS